MNRWASEHPEASHEDQAEHYRAAADQAKEERMNKIMAEIPSGEVDVDRIERERAAEGKREDA